MSARLYRRLRRIATNHGAAYVQLLAVPHGWKIDIPLPRLGGVHRIGSDMSLRKALRQAEQQVPGATMPLHPTGEDHISCRCQHFRSVHGGPPRGAGCRFPGCPCDDFKSWASA